MNLAQHTILHCAANLGLRLDSSNQVQIKSGDNYIACSPHALLVLDAFAQPRSLGAGLAGLRHNVVGMQDWIDLTTVVSQLYEGGVLRAEDLPAPQAPDTPALFSVEASVETLNDTERVAHVLTAIREVVRPGDVVLNINAGAGIYAIASALAGASTVYAIEGEDNRQLTRAVCEANGVADRITLLGTLPTPDALPAPADLVVADITCGDILVGDVPAILRATRQFLRPDARTLPMQLQLWALPVTIPLGEIQRRTFTPAVVDDWRAWYGIDFSPFVQIAADSALLYPLQMHSAAQWPALAAPALLLEEKLLESTGEAPTVTVPITATSTGFLNGLVIYLDMQYSPSVSMSTHPAQVAHGSSYQGFFWAFDHPIEVCLGDQLVLSYERASISNDLRFRVERVLAQDDKQETGR